MPKITRVGVTFPPKLLLDFDRILSHMGYKSRSKAIHDTVRAFVDEQKWLLDLKGFMVGVIVILYSHGVRQLESDLTETQHDFSSVVCASMHIHVSKEKCLEAIAVNGESEKIKQLLLVLKARKGVESVRLNVFTP